MSRKVPENPSGIMYHDTDKDGYNRIRAEVRWRFKIHQPPRRDDKHPPAAYFTPLAPTTKDLAVSISLPGRKLEFVFAFRAEADLERLEGGRRGRIMYRRSDYVVPKHRQVSCGPSESCPDLTKGGGT